MMDRWKSCNERVQEVNEKTLKVAISLSAVNWAEQCLEIKKDQIKDPIGGSEMAVMMAILWGDGDDDSLKWRWRRRRRRRSVVKAPLRD